MGGMGEPDMVAKLHFLQQAASYGTPNVPVQTVETHMSWVFLVGSQVYKLKKPVRFPYLDFSTLASRAFYCREELRLNARLAPGVYLGVAALQWQGGAFRLVQDCATTDPAHARTSVVDWLVCMQRLPWEQTLHQRIVAGRVTPTDVDALLARMAAFYRSATPAPLGADAYLARFQAAHAANREVLLRPQFGLLDAGLATDQLGDVLVRCAGALGQRARLHRVLDGHGDLRPEHVFFVPSPVVIDCIEFNTELRQVDPFDEFAYLGLECSVAGAAWIGPRLLRGLAQALEDDVPAPLLHFYTAHRALLRARLAMAHLLDPEPRSPARWPPLAARYIAHALATIQAIDHHGGLGTATAPALGGTA